MLAGVQGGAGSTLVVRGQAGIGKTALLDWTADQAAGMLVARVVGAESETHLGFAGLHQMLVPVLDGLAQLPEPQRDALSAAFGLVAGTAPDRFLIGLATLTLLTEAAVRSPVLCVIDDAQWLDHASLEVMSFVARRLLADRVGMVFAVGDGNQHASLLDGLPELIIGALPEHEAIELLAATADLPLDPQVGKRIVAETAGNPLALREFGTELTAAEASGAVPLAEPLRFSGRLEELYRSRVQALPPAAQQLLAVIAADQAGEPGRIWAAAARLGIDPEAAAAPALDRLVSWTPGIRFRHPLMRSAAYYAVSAPVQWRVHGALAAVTDPATDPDRRAWHLAAAARGPDEEVAAELERSADRARSRGGWASGAAFLERAAGLTPDAARRAGRLLDAAEARFMAGEAAVVHELLRVAVPGLVDPVARAKARRLEGLTLHAAGEPAAAATVLLDAADMFAPNDGRLARDTLLDALVADYFSVPSGPARARALHRASPLPPVRQGPSSLADLLLDGFAATGEQRYEAGIALLRQATTPLRSNQPLPDDLLRVFLPMSMAASLLLDDSAWHELEDRWVGELRGRGALAALLVALTSLAYNQVQEGRFADAEATVAEGRALSEATGFRAHLGLFACADLAIMAWRGDPAARSRGAQLLDDLTSAGHGLGAHLARTALCQLEVGLGNYDEAARIALEGGHLEAIGTVVDMVEAGWRSGHAEAAGTALDRFAPLAIASGTPAALGWLDLCRALAADAEHAEAHYQRATRLLRGSRHVPMLARAHLLYGEWLRRQRRRRDARDQLGTAFEMLDSMGMAAFAARARAELRATGEHARPRGPQGREVLTPQEEQIARLVAEHLTNREIAARLFISASTVEYHLAKVFRKLSVTSRTELARMLRKPGGSDGPL
jgi:DNA-binding CsgD family transcriptional regulator